MTVILWPHESFHHSLPFLLFHLVRYILCSINKNRQYLRGKKVKIIPLLKAPRSEEGIVPLPKGVANLPSDFGDEKLTSGEPRRRENTDRVGSVRMIFTEI